MATKAEIYNKVNEAQRTQRFEKTFDLVRTFTAKANTSDSVTIPVTNEGPFILEGYNIAYTKNSTTTPDGGSAKSVCFTKLKFKSQSAGNAMSSDFVPVQLIASPGSDDSPRYGSRPFFYFFPKGDALTIEYDNRAPAALNGETNVSKDERIDICFKGCIYPNIENAKV